MCSNLQPTTRSQYTMMTDVLIPKSRGGRLEEQKKIENTQMIYPSLFLCEVYYRVTLEIVMNLIKCGPKYKHVMHTV